MKKFTKILMAVAAVFAVSCTTDVTEDLGVQLGNEGQTTITLSLEASRTQLGEKAGDLYPLYWSEGDKISVNGVESSEAVISADNAANASFSVAASTPYCIAYPAAAEGQVVFADKQVHAGNGTFASGVSTMYAYSADGFGVGMKHLTGVLKIGVTGSAKLVLAQISNANRKPIAGAFDFDFEKGEATATASSKEVIEYSFGEGVQLSSEATYIHAVVPAGEYDELYVTLYDENGGVMYATVKADEEKPLAAGKVREFSNNVVYAATESVFVVKDVASLKAFAEQAATLEKDVLFVADVDMTGEAWTPIEGYAKTVLGNGYAIKGMTAPLFGTTSASFKGLHLRDVALNSNNNARYGALACEVVATDATIPVVENCSVSGTLVVENPEYVPATTTVTDKKYANNDAKASEMAYAGLVALSRGASFENCVNNVAITVNQIAKDGDTADIVPSIGGITGNAFYVALTEGKVFTSIENCENKANILYKDNSCSTEMWEVFPAVGGITGAVYHNTGIVKGSAITAVSIHNCINRGNITMQAVTGGQSQDTQGYPQTQVGGVVGRGAYISLIGCKNYGTLKYDGTFAQLHAGGVAGSSYYSNVIDCHNYGEMYVTENSFFHGISLAGISAMNYNSADYPYLTNDCTNNGPIKCYGSTLTDVAAGGTWHYRIGGIDAFGRVVMENCTNNKGGTIHIKGNIINLRKTDMFCEVGGVTAYRTTNAWEGCKNYADIISEINFTIHSDITDDVAKVTDRSFFIGGVAGYTSMQCLECENHGNVIVKGSYAGEKLFVGGVVGYGNLRRTRNYGNVTIDESCSITTSRASIGGVLGGNDGTEEREGVINKGNLYIGGVHQAPMVVGGIAGQCRHGARGWVNDGHIYLTGTSTQPFYVGGIVSMFVRHYAKTSSGTTSTVDEGTNGPMYDCVNNGNFYAQFPNSTGSTLHIGGVCRQCQHTMSGCTNNGNAFVTGSVGSTFYYGGLVTVNSACLRENSVNNGNLTVSSPIIGTANSGADCFIGGLCYSGGSNTTYSKCVNNGDITIESNVKIANCTRIGGLIANVETSDKTNIIDACENNGDIIMKGTNGAQSNGVCRLGGMFGQFTNGTLKVINGFKNTGKIEFAGQQTGTSGTSIAGIIGGSDGSAAVWSAECSGNIINEGNIVFSGKTPASAFIGGIAAFMNPSVPPASVKLINTGNLSLTGVASATTISGICGNIKAPIANAQCFCDIYAPGYGEDEVGFLSGKVRSATVTYTDAKVGGRICVVRDEEDLTEKWYTLNSSNYFSMIYNLDSATEESVANDNITVVTSKNDLDYSVIVPETGTEE